MKKIFIAAIALPFLTWLCYVSLFAAAAASIVNQIPDPARGAYQAWLNDVPQETYIDHEGTPGEPYSGGSIPKDGYTGPVSFACILPPQYGYLTDTYGTYRTGGYIHSGIDYGCYGREDLPVYTPYGGKVVFAGWSRVGYGNLVVIENNGVQVYLAHNSELWVAPGDIVTAGTPIGRCGSTGNSTGPHVHFEVRLWNEREERWKPVDPNAIWLPGQSADCLWYHLKEEMP